MPLKVHTCFPLLAQYLWMKIDFVAMVRVIDDPEALAAAQKLAQEGKTYIVFLRSNHEPALGWDQASGYTVDIVTRGPRLVNTIQGFFSSDMYVPVHPFTHPQHPSLRPDRPLPFPDCTHWLGCTVDVAVRRVSEGLDNNKAYQLPFIQFPGLLRAHATEWTRFRDERHKTSRSGKPQAWEDDPYRNRFVPLVNVGIDIDQQFTESDQPPTIYDFFEEREKIQRVLKTALNRATDLGHRAALSSSNTMQSSDSLDSPGQV